MTFQDNIDLTNLLDKVARQFHENALRQAPEEQVKRLVEEEGEESMWLPYDELAGINRHRIKEALLPTVMATLAALDEMPAPGLECPDCTYLPIDADDLDEHRRLNHGYEGDEFQPAEPTCEEEEE